MKYRIETVVHPESGPVCLAVRKRIVGRDGDSGSSLTEPPTDEAVAKKLGHWPTEEDLVRIYGLTPEAARKKLRPKGYRIVSLQGHEPDVSLEDERDETG